MPGQQHGTPHRLRRWTDKVGYQETMGHVDIMSPHGTSLTLYIVSALLSIGQRLIIIIPEIFLSHTCINRWQSFSHLSHLSKSSQAYNGSQPTLWGGCEFYWSCLTQILFPHLLTLNMAAKALLGNSPLEGQEGRGEKEGAGCG